jgi:segregation and condensation protein B
MALSHSARLLATLFAAGEPLAHTRLMKLLDLTKEDLADARAEVHGQLKGTGLALIETEGELELRTAPEASATVKKLRESELSRDLGKASLETLAMVLYRGSATRGEIDWVRGVNSAAAIRSLTLRGLLERTEDASDKRRARYVPTVDALAHLGVRRKEDLPRYAEFTASIAHEEAKAETASDV